MKKIYLISVLSLLLFCNALQAQEEHHETSEETLKRNKVGIVLGNSLIHGVQSAQTGKEQYVLAPTFGLDYEYWLSRKWAIGTYNEFSHLDIEVETEEHEEYIKRENTLLFSGVVVYEILPRWSVFAGTGVETDPNETLWIRYFGTEYAFIQNDDWEIAVSAGYINKDFYNAFNFGVVIGRRFGKPIPAKHRD